MGAVEAGTGGFEQGELAGMPRRLFRASPSKLLAWVDCPRRYRMQYLDRPTPPTRPQRAHTSLGVAVHNALRDWWDLPGERRTPAAGAELVRLGGTVLRTSTAGPAALAVLNAALGRW